jgi:hypothetical protein
MNNRIGGMASLAAGLAVVSLLAFSVYEFAQRRRQSQNS